MTDSKILKMEVSKGVFELLSTPSTPEPSDDFYTFEGDLCQMLIAAKIAKELDIETGVVGGLPYVRRKEEYDKVVKYIVNNKIDGYWHYSKK